MQLLLLHFRDIVVHKKLFKWVNLKKNVFVIDKKKYVLCTKFNKSCEKKEFFES